MTWQGSQSLPDFILVCKPCLYEGSKLYAMPDDAVIEAFEQHFQVEHDTDKVALQMLWTGDGPAPEARKEG